jgi:hypothetical protein
MCQVLVGFVENGVVHMAVANFGVPANCLKASENRQIVDGTT